MTIAILGASGQLGRDLHEVLGNEAVALTRADADLTQTERLRQALAASRPDVVVNCAAYNFVDRAEAEPESAFAVNALGVRTLALVCRDLGCCLAHISSDYVYGLDAARQQPYRENEATGPVSVYGASKAAGEWFVRALCPRHFVVRTCGLYGRHGVGGKGGNFVETMLSRAAAGTPLRVVADQHCTPTSTAELAPALAALLRIDRYGLYHLTAAGSCSWHEFATEIFALAGMKADLTPIASAEFAAAAARPRYSVLDCSRYDALGLGVRRPWQEGLRDYLARRA
jgi:dTDP-4-dehydrorhamnose reductase